MLCGGWTPVLRVLVCASWIMRTSSITWFRPSSSSRIVALKAFSVLAERADGDRPGGGLRRRLLRIEDVFGQVDHVGQLCLG